MLALPRGGRRIELRALHVFESVAAKLTDEMYASIIDRPNGWLARRLTAGALEVWTSKHGWLFDGRGKLLREASPSRGTGHGREWYGAFLPDGRWVTTDVEDFDGKLYFHASDGTLLRTTPSDELAPAMKGDSGDLIGWARSDRRGEGWVVSVGSEEGRATVWVGSEGPARILDGTERWKLCYPRALGPRGWYIEMSVPDDAGELSLSRGGAGHGPGVGFPVYARTLEDDEHPDGHRVPDGGYNFGFWPGKTSFFVGAESDDDRPSAARHTRKFWKGFDNSLVPVVDKTWLFNEAGQVVAWVRARRIGDAADGRAMLFRVTEDSRVATIGPDLKIEVMRRFVWKNGAVGDAVWLWDDLRLGLFVRQGRLVLASWAK